MSLVSEAVKSASAYLQKESLYILIGYTVYMEPFKLHKLIAESGVISLECVSFQFGLKIL